MAILANLEWSGPARHLLESTHSLDPERPAVMHIRHTARTGVSKAELKQFSAKYDQRTFLSTPEGIQAAIEFGSSLPQDREYSLFHTWYDRARETAEGIGRGIIDAGGRARLAGEIPTAVVDHEANDRWAQSQRWFPQDGAYNSTCLWIAGLRPKSLIKPSWEFAQEYARITMENLRDARSNAFHIYVSHDSLILALIFHWLGIPPYGDGIRFLEGLLMQLCEEGMKVWLRDRNEIFNLPYWWPKPS